ncbi:MAG: hypothetical protein JWM74_3166 [Myxococcaceae bacterium]|nr:hypothetical protein [Myxococcaceae bacterium]
MKTRSPLARTLVVLLGATSLFACRSENIDSGSTPAPTQAPPAVTTAAVTATPAPTATPPPPRPKAKIAPFAEASKALDKRCVPKLPANASNIDTKTAAAQTAECMKKAFTADLDAVIVPVKNTDPARFNAVMREQASWNKLAEDLCWLAEESFWVDFDKGMRDDGTMRGLPWVGCKAQAASERDYYALALKADDAAALATRIEQLAKAGTRSKELLAEMSKGAAKLAETRIVDAGPPGSYPHMLTLVERGDLVTRTKSIEDKSREVAHATCTWAALAETLGGSAACEEAAALYYLGHANLEGNRGH